MKGLQGSEKCRRIVCYDAGCSPNAYLDVFLTATASLMLSNDVRRDACVVACFGRPVGGVCLRYRLVFYGYAVKGLRMDENVVEGVARSLLRRGRWPGIIVERLPDGEPCCSGCVGVEDVLSGRDCGRVICLDGVRGLSFKAWWLAASVMVACDGWEAERRKS